MVSVASGKMPAVGAKYDKELIEDECLAIESIFGSEKCKIVRTSRVADTKSMYLPPRVQLDLCSVLNKESAIMQVEFKFPKYYPMEEGIHMRVVNSSGISKKIVQKTVNLAAILSSEKVGAPMIYDIATDINAFLEVELVGMSEKRCKQNTIEAGITRVIPDEKNSGYYNFFGTNNINRRAMKRQCTEDINHFSSEHFISSGFTCINKDSLNSISSSNNECSVWRRCNPEIMVIHNPLHMAPIEISAVGVKQDDIDEWLNLFLMHYTISSSEDLLNSLVNWVKGYLVLGDASGDVDSHTSTNKQPGYFVPEEYTLEKLPSVEALEKQIGRSIETGRKLHIITWGDKRVRKCNITQMGAEAHFNAKPLDGRGGGADLKMNATQDPRIVRNVVQSMTSGVGAMWLERAINKIEQSDLHCISTFCAQGRHRSTSSALILKAKYYPNATLEHVKMK